MEIRLFNYEEPKLLSSYGNLLDVNSLAQAATLRIVRDVNNSLGATIITINSAFIDDRAQMHCDKWIEETATHMSRYSAAQNLSDKPRLATPPSGTVSDPLRRLLLQYKSFSGDVSGVIGEAIFSSLLILHFGLKDNAFAHFRADKLSGIFPDFGIFQPSTELITQFEWNGVPLSGPAVIPAEVKTVTSVSVGHIKPRLIKAAEQLQNFWVRVLGRQTIGTGEAALICLVIRNQERKAYDVALLWGR